MFQILLAAAATLVLAQAAPASADHDPSHRVFNIQGPPIREIVVTDSDAKSTNSTTFTNIPDSSATVGVAPFYSYLIRVQFHAGSHCTGGGSGNWCSIRIMFERPGGDLVAGHPQGGRDSVFDSVGGVEDFWESHSIERTICFHNNTRTIVELDVLPQWSVTNAATKFRLNKTSTTVSLYSAGRRGCNQN